MTFRSLFADRRLWGMMAAAAIAWPTTTLAQPRAKPPAGKAAKAAPKDKVAPRGAPAKGADAKGDDMAAAPQVDALDLNVARKDLAGADVDGAVDAADRLGKSKDPKATDVLLDALAVGASPRVAAAALESLAKQKSPRAVTVLLHFSRNRHSDLRRKALVALGPFKEPRVTQAIMVRLGDSAKDVRATAARLLAERKERGAERILLKLIKRGDEAAATALGLVMTADSVRRVAELHGTVPEGLLASALGEYVKRPDVADATRVDVIRTLGKMPGAEATAALIEYIGSVPQGHSRASKTEAQKLIEQRSK
jgi:HEAT repeat protein